MTIRKSVVRKGSRKVRRSKKVVSKRGKRSTKKVVSKKEKRSSKKSSFKKKHKKIKGGVYQKDVVCKKMKTFKEIKTELEYYLRKYFVPDIQGTDLEKVCKILDEIKYDSPRDLETDITFSIDKAIDLSEYIPSLQDTVILYASDRPSITRFDTCSGHVRESFLWLWYHKGVRLYITLDDYETDTKSMQIEEKILIEQLNKLLEKIIKSYDKKTDELKMESIQLKDFTAPTTENFNKLFKLLETAKEGIYFHCGSGQGRTGIMLIAAIIYYYYKYIKNILSLKKVAYILMEKYSFESFMEIFESNLRNIKLLTTIIDNLILSLNKIYSADFTNLKADLINLYKIYDLIFKDGSTNKEVSKSLFKSFIENRDDDNTDFDKFCDSETKNKE